jgi:zinc transporter 2
MIGELVGGYLSGSLAIMTDAAHLLSDVAGFLISYFAIYMSNRPANH